MAAAAAADRRLPPPYTDLSEDGNFFEKIRGAVLSCVKNNITKAFVFQTGITSVDAYRHILEFITNILSVYPNFDCSIIQSPHTPLVISCHKGKYYHPVSGREIDEMDIEHIEYYTGKSFDWEQEKCFEDKYVPRTYVRRSNKSSFVGILVYRICDSDLLTPLLLDKYTDLTKYNVNFVIPIKRVAMRKTFMLRCISKKYGICSDIENIIYGFLATDVNVNFFSAAKSNYGTVPRKIVNINIQIAYYTNDLHQDLYASMRKYETDDIIVEQLNNIYHENDIGHQYESLGFDWPTRRGHKRELITCEVESSHVESHRGAGINLETSDWLKKYVIKDTGDQLSFFI